MMVSVSNDMREGERPQRALQRFRSELALQGSDDGVVFRRCGCRLLDRTGGGVLGVVHRLNTEADMKQIAKEPGKHLPVPVDAGLLELSPAADPDAAACDAGQPCAVHDRTERDLSLPDGCDELLPAGLNLPFGDRRGAFCHPGGGLWGCCCRLLGPWFDAGGSGYPG